MEIENKIAIIISSKVRIEDIKHCIECLIDKYPTINFILFGYLPKDFIVEIKGNKIFNNVFLYSNYNFKNFNIVRLFVFTFFLSIRGFTKTVLIIDPFSERLYTKDKMLASLISFNAIGIYNPRKRIFLFYPRIVFLVKTINDILKVYFTLIKDILFYKILKEKIIPFFKIIFFELISLKKILFIVLFNLFLIFKIFYNLIVKLYLAFLKFIYVMFFNVFLVCRMVFLNLFLIIKILNNLIVNLYLKFLEFFIKFFKKIPVSKIVLKFFLTISCTIPILLRKKIKYLVRFFMLFAIGFIKISGKTLKNIMLLPDYSLWLLTTMFLLILKLKLKLINAKEN